MGILVIYFNTIRIQVRQRKENDHCIWQNGGLLRPYKNSFGAVVGAEDRLK